MILVKILRFFIPLFLTVVMYWYIGHIMFIIERNMVLFNHDRIRHISTDDTTESYDKVFYSIKTTGKNHKSRLQILIDTWIPIVKMQVCS